MTEIELTQEQLDEGYHYCPDWDFLLIWPGCPEYESCYCDIKLQEKK